MVALAIAFYLLPQQIAGNAPPPPPAQLSAPALATPQIPDASRKEEYSSSQVTFFDGPAQNGDGRVDVMHFQDGKTAMTAGKDWTCSYLNDPVQHRVAILCSVPHP